MAAERAAVPFVPTITVILAGPVPSLLERLSHGTGEAAFADAMQRLLDAGTIRIETYGRPSRPSFKLVRA